jgi:hypothetical protein
LVRLKHRSGVSFSSFNKSSTLGQHLVSQAIGGMCMILQYT